jgi:predicted thioesterase
VNGSRTPRPSIPRTIFPLLMLVAIVVALVAAATPALAFGGFQHDEATKAKCDIVGCHKDDPATNATCTQATCHASGYTTSGSKKCWDCHKPGAAPSATCTGTCHLFQTGGGEDYTYQTAFTHGTTPHLGASGYGKTCANCHGAGNAHHDATAGHQPTCAECHNGSLAKAPSAAHATRSTNCATCHNGMNLPSGDCAACHVGNPGSGGPQIAYSKALACGDARCHGKIANHSGTPISAAACTTCHASHYETLGACTKCHTDPQRFHHRTDKATALTDCVGCHNGAVAAAPTAHASYGTNCATCHTGMNRPSGDCLACHDKPQGGVPAVVFTNDLGCSDVRCHAKIVNHSGTPIRAAACTSCHAAHYESLGACTTCHADPKTFHHGTAKATPLAECATCHDGKIATAKQAHAGMSCASCHTGMAKPPVPVTCQKCHEAATFGETTCTACHSATGMIGKETVHATDPAATVACTTCHEAHYQDLGACSTCHGSHAETHHATATLVDTQLTLKAAATKVKGRRRARLGGTLLASGQPIASQSVLIQRKLKNGSFKKVAVVKTGAKGAYTRVVKLRFGTQYRAVWRPAGVYVTQQRPAVVTAKLRRVRT